MNKTYDHENLIAQNRNLEANNQLLQTELDYLKQNFNYQLDKKLMVHKTLLDDAKSNSSKNKQKQTMSSLNKQNKKLTYDIKAILLFLNKPLWGWFFRLNPTFSKLLKKYLNSAN